MVLLTGMMGAGYSATALVIDVRSGYLDRLRVLPVHPVAIVLGRLLFDMVRVLPAGALVLAVSVALGGEVRGGLLGAVAILGLLALWSLAYSGIFYAVGLRTVNPQAPFALLPIFVPLMFLTTVFASPGHDAGLGAGHLRLEPVHLCHRRGPGLHQRRVHVVGPAQGHRHLPGPAHPHLVHRGAVVQPPGARDLTA